MGSLMLLATNSPPFPFMNIKVFTDKGLRRNKEPVVSPIFRRNQVNGHLTPERYAQKMGLINLQLQKALFHGKIVFPNCLSS
ncbi:hypothetical protein L596_022244 [Steinernema carpocapsae]|uniref:Uncharacterized protein n=1 Tax=Steinernema carpocapsae TaxID=34508 RepID=A0A4U5MLI9_STECR|nr:hypothetical protein L596_022244 [Steinernema carpocapsae]